MQKQEKEFLLNALFKDEGDTMINKKTVVGYCTELESLSLLSKKRLERIKNCLSYRVLATNEEITKKKELVGYACEDRFCPVCQKRKANNDFKALLAAFKLYLVNKNLKVSFLTLTVVNVESGRLKASVEAINRGIKKLFKRKLFAGFIDSHVIKIEITYNSKSKTFHPHAHLILLTDYSFSVLESSIIEEWNSCYYDSLFLIEKKKKSKKRKVKVGKSYRGEQWISQVKLQTVSDDNLSKSLLELAKYSVKSSDYSYSLEVFKTFFEVIKGKQLLRVNGGISNYYTMIVQLTNNPVIKSFFHSFCFNQKKEEEVFYTKLFSALFNHKEESFSFSELSEKDDGYNYYFKLLESLNKKECSSLEDFFNSIKEEKSTNRLLIEQLEKEKEIHRNYSDESSFLKRQKRLYNRIGYLEQLEKVLEDLEKKESNNNQ